MPMKRVAAPLICVGLLAAGCDAGSALTVHNTLPDKLPTAVAADIGSVAAINFIYQGDLGSAVHIDFGQGNLYLSAGHLVMNGHDKPKKMSRDFGYVQIDVPSKSAEFSNTEGNTAVYNIGVTLLAERLVASYVNGDQGSTPDISLLQAPSCPNQEVKNLPKIANNKPSVGSNVYFENFETVSHNIFRTPVWQDSLLGLGKDIKYSKPAVYGGIVTSFQSNGDFVVTDGLRSYGNTSQNVTTRGASGGPVFNQSGKLLGISVESSLNPSDPIAIVQPVNTGLIDKLEHEMITLHVVHGDGGNIC